MNHLYLIPKQDSCTQHISDLTVFGLGKPLGTQPLVETLTGCGASWISQTMAPVKGTLTKARSLIELEKKIILLVLKFYMVRITKFICLG
jgi:hypothetical protein